MKRYPWLDGIRGLAALYVLLHHAASEVKPENLPIGIARAMVWLSHGRLAVAVFIVLSGFSLMLPVVRDGAIRGGLRGYMTRRAWRILPPYYAALVLILLLIAVSPALWSPIGNARWNSALPAMEAGPIVSHLLMVHNFSLSWLYKIDQPMWSVALEWQIYFLFPILVLAWRRVGHSGSLVLALSTSYAAMSLMGVALSGQACPWYAGLFAIGMTAASATVRPMPASPRLSWLLWIVASLLMFDLCFPDSLIPVGENNMVRDDMLMGLITAGVLAILIRFDRGGEWLVSRFLGSRPCVALGAISYSLYLIHFPLLSLVSNLMVGQRIGPTTRLAVLLFVAAPVILLIAYAFHLAFEKPFVVGFRHESRVTGANPLTLVVIS